MTGYIDAEYIKETLPLPTLIEVNTGQRIPHNGMIRCPFHDDHNPSLMVYAVKPYKKGWYCFGCHKGGSVIDWVMEWEHLGFYDALKFIADNYYEKD